MKVKPFYIRITVDMTNETVQDAFDKCHRLGVRASDNDNTENFRDWSYFGVCARDGTYLSDSCHGYFGAQEITLDQLDEWLGLDKAETPEEKEAFDSMANNSELPNSSEWDGKGLPPVGAVYTVDPNYDGELLCKYSSEYVVVGEMLPRETYKGMEVIIDVVRQRNRVFKKPETPQQREERERLEAAYDLYVTAQESLNVIGCESFQQFTNDKVQVKFWLAIVDKTGYRKAK